MDIKIDYDYSLPIYMQIVDQINENVSKGNLRASEKMLSVNKFSEKYNVARQTIEKAYKLLIERKILVAYQGKGTYVNDVKAVGFKSVVFFVDKLTNQNLDIYNSFLDSLGSSYYVCIELYHGDDNTFLSLLAKHLGRVDFYVVVPQFKFVYGHGHGHYPDLFNNIPKDKLIILNNDGAIGFDESVEIYQDYEQSFYTIFKSKIDKIEKYKKIILLGPVKWNYTYLYKIYSGVRRFCLQYNLDLQILNEISGKREIEKDDLYLILEDNLLIEFLDLIRYRNLTLGTGVGVISFGETPFKRLLDISVVSPNYIKMGATAAEMMHHYKYGKLKEPLNFICRSSI